MLGRQEGIFGFADQHIGPADIRGLFGHLFGDDAGRDELELLWIVLTVARQDEIYLSII